MLISIWEKDCNERAFAISYVYIDNGRWIRWVFTNGTSWCTANHNSSAKNGVTLPSFNGFGNVSTYTDELLGHDIFKRSRVCRWFN